MFINGMREDGEGDFLSLCLIMVFTLMKPKGLGMVIVGLDLKKVLVKIIIDKKVGENDLKIF
jgi:hypothetical protein